MCDDARQGNGFNEMTRCACSCLFSFSLLHVYLNVFFLFEIELIQNKEISSYQSSIYIVRMHTRARMVNKATGASPPYSTTREMASSPVNFDSSIQSSTSDSSSCSSTMVCAEKDNIQDVMVMNKYVLFIHSFSMDYRTDNRRKTVLRIST
jgi:hypothetical protein